MKIIAHRGNINGPDPLNENTIDYLKYTYEKGFDVECDIIGHNGKLYFGHDVPQEPVDIDFIYNTGVWCHAKNIEALENLSKLNVNYFWHEDDAATITSKGYIWCYPGKFIKSKNAVWLDLFDTELLDYTNIYGICTDKGLVY
jgi:hypothetical protein